MNTFTANTERELKKIIQSECNFTGKSVSQINGIDLKGRNDLAELKISNKNCCIETYTTIIGHKTHFLSAPFTVNIQ